MRIYILTTTAIIASAFLICNPQQATAEQNTDPRERRIFDMLGEPPKSLMIKLKTLGSYRCSERWVWAETTNGSITFRGAPREQVKGLSTETCRGPVKIETMVVDNKIINITARFRPDGKNQDIAKSLYRRYTSNEYKQYDYWERSRNRHVISFHTKCPTPRDSETKYFASKKKVSSFTTKKDGITCVSLTQQSGIKEYWKRIRYVEKKLWDRFNTRKVKPDDF